MSPIGILRKHLAAVALFSGKNDIRNYLNGVHVEVFSTEVRLVATDGDTAAISRHKVENADPFKVTIPIAAVELVLKTKSEVLSLDHDGTNWYLSGVRFTPVVGAFPNYRRVIPTTHSGIASQFNPEYVARAGKAGKALGIRSAPIIRHNGDGAALFHFYANDEFIGVIMPLNTFTKEKPDMGVPTWGPELADDMRNLL